MGEDGIVEVSDPSGLFTSRHEEPVPGTCVTVTMEGRRPLLAELQALVGKSSLPVPRRTMHGVDSGRLAMVLAVLERRARVRLHDSDVYVSTVGGARVVDPSADLAAAVAVASSALDVSLTQRCVAIGEVGLAGELRRVPGPGAPTRRGRPARLHRGRHPVRRATVGADRDESARAADPRRAAPWPTPSTAWASAGRRAVRASDR